MKSQQTLLKEDKKNDCEAGHKCGVMSQCKICKKWFCHKHILRKEHINFPCGCKVFIPKPKDETITSRFYNTS